MTNLELYHQNRMKYVPVDSMLLLLESKRGLTAKDMSTKYGWSRHSVYDYYRKHGHPQTALQETQLTDVQKDIVIGSLLGDGSIRPVGIFVIGHGVKQREYLEWKVNQMSPFMSKIKKRDTLDNRSGRRDIGYYSYSHTLEVFREYRKLFYPDHKKIFPNLESISPLALAIWYMDDGSYAIKSGRSCLCSQSFTREENQMAVDLLQKQYGINAKIHKAGVGQFRIGMNRDASNTLFKVIEPYMHYSMLYKMNFKEVQNGF